MNGIGSWNLSDIDYLSDVYSFLFYLFYPSEEL
mgnify:CR=1 FL=1